MSLVLKNHNLHNLIKEEIQILTTTTTIKKNTQIHKVLQFSSKLICVDFKLENLRSNHGLWEKISSYHPNKHDEIRRFYLLVKLVLTLLVASVTVEISFSAMKHIKNELRNRIGDQWMNNCLIVYIEKDGACSIDNETIMQRFQNIKMNLVQKMKLA